MNPGACRQSSTVLFGSVEIFIIIVSTAANFW